MTHGAESATHPNPDKLLIDLDLVVFIHPNYILLLCRQLGRGTDGTMLKLLATAASGAPAGLPALWRLSRSVTSSSTPAQAQPQPQASEPAEQEASLPRWARELGVIRTDWT